MAWLQFLVLQEHKQLTPVSFKKTQNSSHGWFVKFVSEMILPQVHLRKPCYDFYFL